jgi:N-methylhydantoinase A
LQAEHIESVAVCLLFSFLRPEHERRVRAILEEGNEKWEAPASSVPPHFSISLSSDILPEYREYERVSTTVINAYVAPLIDRYLARLERELHPRPLRIMQSNGGCLTSGMARTQAARTALSGPAGGVVGAFEIARQALATAPAQTSEGRSGIITFDMGGTSTDVCLCPGHIPFTSEGEIGGMPLRLPIIDIHTVGAGGGSLARLDAGGALTVGPESAGAEPGPICYGRGGRVVTVTDANLILNRLDPAHFLGGQLRLEVEPARAALAELARAIGSRTPEAAAWGVLQIANATMERAIRRISVERGHDPRDFTLVAFGGAGPLHACELAERLAAPSAPRVLVPRAPGVLSALGMLLADLVKDYSRTVMCRAEGVTGADLAAWFEPLAARARADMAQDGVSAPRLDASIDARYAGQSFELNVPFAWQHDGLALVIGDFHARHAQRYGHAHPDQPVEIVTVRLRAVGPTPRPALEELPVGDADASAACVGEREVWFGGEGGEGPRTARLYERASLLGGNRLTGPAVVFQLDATTAVPPGWAGRVDRLGHLLLEKM